MQTQKGFGTEIKLKDDVVTDVKTMKKFYFTFGFGQKHEGGFHVIQAYGWGAARTLMNKRFGKNWAFQYTERLWYNEEGVSQEEEYNLHEVV